jgi:hypothetical protein
METLIKFLLALTIAAVAVDLTNPDFFRSLIEGLRKDGVAYKQAEPSGNVELQRLPKIPQSEGRKVALPKQVEATSAPPDTLWGNTYSIQNPQVEKSRELASKLSVQELMELTEHYSRLYQEALASGASQEETLRAFELYKMHRDALRLKNRF